MLESITTVQIVIIAITIALIIGLQYISFSLPALTERKGLIAFYLDFWAAKHGYIHTGESGLKYRHPSKGFVKYEEVYVKVIATTNKLQLAILALGGTLTGIDLLDYFGIFTGVV